MPLLETRGSGSALAYGLNSFIRNDFEADPYAQYLVFATPLNDTVGTADVSHIIRNSGTRKQVRREGSTVGSPSFISNGFTKFYDGSLACIDYTTNRYAWTPNNSDLHLGSGDFTIEGWWYHLSNSVGYQGFASHSGDTTDQQNGWILIMENNNTGPFFLATNGGGGWPISFSSNTLPTVNAWNHLAITRSGNVFRMFLNGVQVGGQTTSTAIASPSSRELRIGSYNFFPGAQRGYNGYIQDFRLYKGIAKYTSNFTPPGKMYTGPLYPSKTDTLGISNLVAWWPLDSISSVTDQYREIVSRGQRSLQKVGADSVVFNLSDGTFPSFLEWEDTQLGLGYLRSVNSFNFSGSSGLSYSAWVKVPSRNNQWLISEGDVNTRWNIFYEPNLIKYRAVSSGDVTYSTDIQDNTWKHVVYTHNISTRETKLYLNGSNVQTGTAGSSSVFSGNYILMGEHSILEGTSSTYRYIGGMARVRLYNKVLSQSEVNTLYNNRLAN